MVDGGKKGNESEDKSNKAKNQHKEGGREACGGLHAQNTHKAAERNVAYVCSGASWRRPVPELHRSKPVTRSPRRDAGRCVDRALPCVCAKNTRRKGRVSGRGGQEELAGWAGLGERDRDFL